MILHNIRVKGFLGHNRENTFDFEGAPLWLIYGENGAGKSSIFDAILFAFYGVQREKKDDGTQKKQELTPLINHGCDKAEVGVEFELGGADNTRYRIERSLKRKSLKGVPTTPEHTQVVQRLEDGQWKDIKETDKKVAEWVNENLGVDYEAFRCSVVLRQGEASAFLDRSEKDRRNALLKLLKLDWCDTLKTDAANTVKEANKALKPLREARDQMEKVSGNDIGAMAAAVCDAERNEQEAQRVRDEARDAQTRATVVEDLKTKIASARTQQGRHEAALHDAKKTQHSGALEVTLAQPLLDAARDSSARLTWLVEHWALPIMQAVQEARQEPGAAQEIQMQKSLARLPLPWHGSAQDEASLGSLMMSLRVWASDESKAEESRENLQATLERSRIEIDVLEALCAEYASTPTLLMEEADSQWQNARRHLEELKNNLGRLQRSQQEYEERDQEVIKAEEKLKQKEKLKVALEKLLAKVSNDAQEKVERATNDTLKKLSGGNWRIVIREKASKGKSKGSEEDEKILEIVACYSDEEERSLGSLSGGEKFLVSVALALGIGRIAHGQSIETLIIDEGFGALDEENRKSLVGVLKNLEDTGIKRLIAVSHQQDVYGTFDKAYFLKKQDDGQVKVSQKIPADNE